jgi:hypothetical protein
LAHLKICTTSASSSSESAEKYSVPEEEPLVKEEQVDRLLIIKRTKE